MRVEPGAGEQLQTTAALERAHRALDVVCTSILYADDIELRAAQPLVDMLRRDVSIRLRARGTVPADDVSPGPATIGAGRAALDEVWRAVVDDDATRDLAALVSILQHTFDRVIARRR